MALERVRSHLVHSRCLDFAGSMWPDQRTLFRMLCSGLCRAPSCAVSWPYGPSRYLPISRLVFLIWPAFRAWPSCTGRGTPPSSSAARPSPAWTWDAFGPSLRARRLRPMSKSRRYPNAWRPLSIVSSSLHFSSSLVLQSRPGPRVSYMRHGHPSTRRRSQSCTACVFSPIVAPIFLQPLPSRMLAPPGGACRGTAAPNPSWCAPADTPPLSTILFASWGPGGRE